MPELLRGELYITIFEAEGLPDCDKAFFNIDPKDFSDPFVTVTIGPARLAKTKVIDNDTSPRWDETFRLPVCHYGDAVALRVKDKDHVKAGDLGVTFIRTSQLLTEEEIEGWYDLIPAPGTDVLVAGRLRFSMQFLSREKLLESEDVPKVYFPPRTGCLTKLYQDASCPVMDMFNGIVGPGGDPYEPACAWKDVYTAITEAQQFIYITGWSVFTEIPLLRGDEGDTISIGELLKQKSEEGVKILMLVWNEKLSTEMTPGLMGTHDEDTRSYFEDTDVECHLIPRIKPCKGFTSFFQDQFVQTCYTHHQKTLILDAPASGEDERPRVIAFVGGLDLTDGRYDTPEHNLFKTLHSCHQGDFYNGCAQTTADEGPRQPWHDIHCKVEGPIALDVLQNFTERWQRQTEGCEDSLLCINDENFNVNVESDDPWTAQLFRSINGDGASFDTDRYDTLIFRKGRLTDASIHTAYIHHIRRAKNFIYIENQYFLGSAHTWDDEQDTKAHHIIPVEIALKIVDKINKGERFTAYVVIPMFPEGDPTSGAVQEILHWQTKTLKMMYGKIAEAISENGIDAHPCDYLQFYCLGKGEGDDEVPEDLATPEDDTPAALLRSTKRFMIYVHSKMMIVDDDYIIIGSANINQRSMAGSRDTEIAVGLYQPAHTVDEEGVPTGEVRSFRMALWAEHMGNISEEMNDPASLECAQLVRKIGDDTWQSYISDDVISLNSHLLSYPLQIEEDGSVDAIEGYENFPDSDASVLGSNSFLPNKLTT